MPRPSIRRLLAPLLLALIIVPFAVPPPRPGVAAPIVNPLQQGSPVRITEVEPNDSIIPDLANAIGDPTADSWAVQATGSISNSADIDVYRFTLSQPGASVRIRLSNLSADYDLVLGGGADSEFDNGSSGLEGIAQVGASITSIGASITSIGASITSIGASITSIGASITSISANSGSEDEEIETILWRPGNYYLAVASSGSELNAGTYTLDVEFTGSGLSQAPPAPHVAVRLGALGYASFDQITTLYLVNSPRMQQLYLNQPDLDATAAITPTLNQLAQFPPTIGGTDVISTNPGLPTDIREFGVVLDMADIVPARAGVPSFADVYQQWDANPGNPFYANYVARTIDHIIAAVSEDDDTPGASSATPDYRIGSVTNLGTVLPNLKYVVLVGNDDVFPFFRIPDLTTIANEADYAEYLRSIDPINGMIEETHPLGAALKYRMLLSDNPYGAGRPYRFYGNPLFLPDLAVGRLVERPSDIMRYLSSVSANSNYSIDYYGTVQEGGRASITGYDFLRDQAAEISRTMTTALTESSGGFSATVDIDTTLVNDLWGRSAFEGRWLESPLDTTFPNTNTNSPFIFTDTSIGSVNAHFDHWQILPAVDSSGNFPASRLVSPDYDFSQCTFGCAPGLFQRTLYYSVGCHSGYNVPRDAISRSVSDGPLYSGDFAEAFMRHAGNWIGNTGYGYGTLDGVDYSERLAVLLTEELFRDVRYSDPMFGEVYVGQPIGQALRNAKLRYIRNATALGVYDAKVVQIMTLYGMPWARVYALTPLPAPPEDQSAARPAGDRAAPIPTPANSLGRLERVITVTIELDNALVDVTRPGGQVIGQEVLLEPENFTIEDSFVQAGFDAAPQVRVFTNSQAGAPSLPTFAYDITALDDDATTEMTVREVQFLGGSYSPTSGFNPQITQIVSETTAPLIETDTEPTFEAGAGVWYPDKFFAASSVGEDEDRRDQLVSAAAQFKADADGSTGEIRLYEQMIFKVIYIDPSAEDAPEALADEAAPTIEEVRIEGVISQEQEEDMLAAEQSLIAVRVSDDGTGLDGVRAVYVQGDTWINLEFSQPNPQLAPKLWTSRVPLAPGDVRVIVSASDRAGNTSYYTAKGSFRPSQISNTIYLPLLRQ